MQNWNKTDVTCESQNSDFYFEIVTSISELQNSENIIWQESGESTSKRYLLFYSTLVINSSFQHKKGKSEIGDLHE